jgi:methoxymalonate biosynthesis acyl carrier protein
MSTQPTANAGLAEPEIRAGVRTFLADRLKGPVEPDTDLFATGLVSSLFALELVVHLEQAYGIAVDGPDLRLDNFRTVDAMTALVLRLSGSTDG